MEQGQRDLEGEGDGKIRWKLLLPGLAALRVLVVAGGVFLAITRSVEGARLVVAPLLLGSIAFTLPVARALPVLHGRGALLWMPLGLLLLAGLAAFCNWVALGSNLIDESSKAFGTREVIGQEEPLSRGLFGLYALLVNVAFLSLLLAWLRGVAGLGSRPGP